MEVELHVCNFTQFSPLTNHPEGCKELVKPFTHFIIYKQLHSFSIQKVHEEDL